MTQTIDVIDISHWQSEPDFAAVKASGIKGVILKATEGMSYVDPTWFDRWSKATQAGLKVATYHYLHGGNIEQQMTHYIETIDADKGERVCIDHEGDATLAELEHAVKFIEDMRPDLQIAIYSGHLLKEQLGNRVSAPLSRTSLWLAQYTSGEPTWPKGTWLTWSLWQFTENASVPGIAGSVDGNTWNGTDENLMKWFGPAAAPKPQSEVIVSVQTPPNVPVTVIVNGLVMA